MTTNAFLTEDRLEMPPWPGTERPADPDRLTYGGVATAAGVLLAILCGTAVLGWNLVEAEDVVRFPRWILGGFLAGAAILFLAYRKPELARWLAPAYAALKGVIVGALSHVYEVRFDGIVLQAALLTLGIFAAMLFIYGTRIIKVTDRLRRGVIAATMGVMAVYLFQIVMSLIGVNFTVPFLHDSGPIGIVINLAIIGLASFNLLVDFDFIERAEKAGAPRRVEWVAALALIATLVWIYIELLRLLSKLRD